MVSFKWVYLRPLKGWGLILRSPRLEGLGSAVHTPIHRTRIMHYLLTGHHRVQWSRRWQRRRGSTGNHAAAMLDLAHMLLVAITQGPKGPPGRSSPSGSVGYKVQSMGWIERTTVAK